MAAVKESVRAGNEYRPPRVSPRDVQEICGAFNALADPLLDHEREPELGALHSFCVAEEQFLGRTPGLLVAVLPLAAGAC